jgi:DNA-binding MarR family transcriptional regulator
MPEAKPSESVVHLLHRAAQVADGLFIRNSRGLTPRQLEVLKAVSAADGTSQIAIVAKTGIDRSSTASLVGKLVRAGYLVRKRKPGDARTNVVRLTADGEYAMRRNLSMAEQVDAELLAPLSQAERSKLRALLRRFSDFHKPE